MARATLPTSGPSSSSSPANTLQRRSSLTPRSSRFRSTRSTEAKYIGVWVLLFVGSCLEAADVLYTVDHPTVFQYTITSLALLVPVFIGVIGLACVRRESSLHLYLGHATFVQLALYIVTCSLSAFASKPIIIAWIIAPQCTVVLFFLLATRFELFGSRASSSVQAIRPWLFALLVFVLRIWWHFASISQEVLKDATYIISATLPTSFMCYICMIWLTTAGFPFRWTFWGPPLTTRGCMSCHWLALLGMQALIGTIVGMVVVTTAMVPNKAAVIPIILIAFTLGGIAFASFSDDEVDLEWPDSLPEHEVHDLQADPLHRRAS